jgi:prophage tail gpP-like protein
MAAEPLILKVNARRFEGWKTVEVEHGLDAMTGGFAVALTDRWEGQPDRWEIEAGQSCQVLIGDEPVLTGYIDAADYDEDRESHPIQITGRGKAADLLDCSAVHTPGSWSHRRLQQIAAELAAPFGIAVVTRADTGEPFARFALNQGETVHEALERMGRLRGVLFVENSSGELEIIKPGERRAGFALIEGENLLSIGFRNDASDRYSKYIVKGYAGGQEGPAARPKGEAEDAGVPRYRPLIVVEGEQATAGGAEARARYEATVRAGRARSVRARVQGWRDAEGALFQPDRMVRTEAPYIGVRQDLLISAVRFILDERGQRTEFTLVPKEAYTSEPIEAEKPKKGRGAKPLTGR